MGFQRVLNAVDVHSGIPMRVVTGGLPAIPGSTMYEKMKWLESNGDDLRKMLLREPRGYPPYCCNLIIPSENPHADMGFIIMEQTEYPVMSGGNTIAVATVLLETGIIPMREPKTEFVLESPAGLIEITAECANGKAKMITFRNVPSFAAYIDAAITVPELGELRVDVGWGGMFYVITDLSQLPQLQLEPEQAQELVRVASMICQAASEQLPVAHPDYPGIGITVSQLSGQPTGDQADSRNAVTMATGSFDWRNRATWTGVLDRCPSGTGTSAKMAVLHAKGELSLREKFRHQGILEDIIYTGELVAEEEVAGRRGVIPQVTGSAWIFGLNTLVLDADDPYPEGFTVGDLWA